MTPSTDLAPLLEGFFTKRLIGQRRASPCTISSYRDTFRLLLNFAQKRLRCPPSKLTIEALNAPFLSEFLDYLEKSRSNTARSRNLRLAAIRSFFRYAAFEAPQRSALIQRVLAIPSKRHIRPVIDFLTPPEIKALLAAVDRKTWRGERDYVLLLVGVQTGLRLSEITNLRYQDISLGPGAHVRCVGKGRKERSTPLIKATASVLRDWSQRQRRGGSDFVFPSSSGGRLSADAVQRLVHKHADAAKLLCPSLAKKRVTPHVLRHTAAMELLQAGIDRSLIAIWLGHEEIETTDVYLDANLALKEEILAKTRPVHCRRGRFRPDDNLMSFLKSL